MPETALQSGNYHRSLSSLDYAGFWHREPWRALWLTAAFLTAYASFAAAGFAMARTFGDFVAFWPAAGLLGGVLVCTPERTWPLWIVGSIGGRLLATAALFDNSPIHIALVFSVASAAEALVFAAFLGKPLNQSLRLGRPLYLMTAMCVMAGASAAAGALLGASIIPPVEVQDTFWVIWRTRFVGDYLGLVIVGPAIAWFLLPQLRIARARRSLPEYLTLLAVTITVIVLLRSALAGEIPALIRVPGALEVLSLVPLIWAAIRLDFPVVSLGLFLLAVGINALTSQNAGPLVFGSLSVFEANAGLQLYLVLVTQVVLFLAFSVLERERAGTELGMRRKLEYLLVSLSNKLTRAESGKVDEIIENALQEIGEFAGADRCLLLQTEPERRTFSETHGWYGPRAGHARKIAGQARIADFPWALKKLQNDGYFSLNHLHEQAPAEFAPLQQALPPSSSILYLGLFTDGLLTGCIGLDWLDRQTAWARESRALLFLVGQLFSNVLKRINAERTIEGYQAKLRAMAHEISRSEERARRKAATDVHDGVGQNLAVARMNIGKVLAAGDYDAGSLHTARDLIDSAIRSTRHVIADLSPAILYELGLVPALRSLAERFEPSCDIRCHVDESGDGWALSDDLKVGLYRVGRELLTNIAKHAHAENATIHIDWTADDIGIAVEDDGVGFEIEKGGPGGMGFLGFGLFSVREGILLLGGRLEIESSRGIGTQVEVRVPRPVEESVE